MRNMETRMTLREITADNLLYALCNLGGDPCIVESEEQAEGLRDMIRRATVYREITDKDEFRTAAEQLDILPCAVRHIYSFVDGSEFIVCFPEDYGD